MTTTTVAIGIAGFSTSVHGVVTATRLTLLRAVDMTVEALVGEQRIIADFTASIYHAVGL